MPAAYLLARAQGPASLPRRVPIPTRPARQPASGRRPPAVTKTTCSTQNYLPQPSGGTLPAVLKIYCLSVQPSGPRNAAECLGFLRAVQEGFFGTSSMLQS